MRQKGKSINIHSFNLIYEELNCSSDKYFCSYIKDIFGTLTKRKIRHRGVAVVVMLFRIFLVHTAGIHTCTCAQGPRSEN